jgi:Domain of unknown function (DUF4365)
MTVIDQNRLKGNYAAAQVTARLSSECLVRPVAADTDVGVDLYCETVENSRPFLHFWIQVKGGSQCKVHNSGTASCSFERKHLEYWASQPVPVFAALVPTDWPVQNEPTVYIVNLTDCLLEEMPTSAEKTLHSTTRWRPNERGDVVDFLRSVVPTSVARLHCRNGTIRHEPTAKPEYVIRVPWVPVSKYKNEIINQITQTAAFGIIQLLQSGELSGENREFRRFLAHVLQNSSPHHWENHAAKAYSFHADGEWEAAVDCYRQAIGCIQRDPDAATNPDWVDPVKELQQFQERALRNERL